MTSFQAILPEHLNPVRGTGFANLPYGLGRTIDQTYAALGRLRVLERYNLSYHHLRQPIEAWLGNN